MTSDGGLILVRELDERLGLSELMDRHMNDSRRGKNIQLLLADLLRQSIYSRLVEYEDVNYAALPFQDPTFRSDRLAVDLGAGAVLTSRLQSFGTKVPRQEGTQPGWPRSTGSCSPR